MSCASTPSTIGVRSQRRMHVTCEEKIPVPYKEIVSSIKHGHLEKKTSFKDCFPWEVRWIFPGRKMHYACFPGTNNYLEYDN